MLVLVLALLVAPPPDPDRATLKTAGLDPDDGAAAASYLRKRGLPAADLAKLKAAVGRLGAEAFADRQAAGREVLGFGPAAAGLLRKAVQADPDPEVQHRASECLRELEKVPHAAVAGAVVRAVVRHPPADAAAVLLGFLPLADDRTVAAEVRAGLVALAVRDGQPDPAVLAALADPTPACRAAAAVALATGGPAGRAARRPDLLPKLLGVAEAEPDPLARFDMLHALATVARHKGAVPPLIDLLSAVGRGRQWMIEDFLLQVAGADAPGAVLGRYTAANDPARDEWLRWWRTAGDRLDLAAVPFTPRTNGGLLLLSSPADVPVAAELGPDGEERWRRPVGRRADVRPLPDGRLHVGEPKDRVYRVSVLDGATGVVQQVRAVPLKAPNQVDTSYTQAHPLADGGVLLVGAGEVAEYPAKKADPKWTFSRRQKLDVATACRLGDGRTLVILKGGPPHGLLLDAAGAEIADRPVPVADPRVQPAPPAVGVGRDRVLIAEPGRLAEYDLSAYKLAWEKPTAGGGSRFVFSVQRLPNGNTLYVEGGGGGQPGRAVEVTREGDEVWAYTPPGGQPGLFRAFQR